MRVTTHGHSCVLVEHGSARVLIDPGTLADASVDDLDGLTAVLVTHAHPDHLDVDRTLALLRRSPGAVVVADTGSAAELRGHGVDVRPVRGGEHVDLGDLRAATHGDDHAVIHPDVAGLPNVGYDLAPADHDGPGDAPVLFHPGDALTRPTRSDGTPLGVDLLCLPLCAPWLLAADAVDALRAVAPRRALLVHDGPLNEAGRQVFSGLLERLAPEGCEVLPPGAGRVVEL